ncbi:MAG TPA: LysM peptidoglycan-binding domain-containing protein [Polyangiaceae bacterium]|jgi:LysM repeat protein
MQRPGVTHIVTIAAVVTACAFVSGVASAKTAPATNTKAAPARSYVVRAGDGGWFQLAKARGTTMPKLLAANHATAATPLKTGQHIRLPADARQDHPRTATAPRAATAKH